MELLHNVAAQRDSPTMIRRSPPYDSRSNGRVERSVRSVEEISRVLKLDLESRAKGKLSVHTPLFSWLLRHGTMLLNMRKVGFDGRTPYERAHHRPYRGELFRFYSTVLFR